MSVPSTTRSVTANCNGSTVAFPFAYPFFNTTDLVVTLITVADGTELVLTETTDYTVSTTGTSYRDGGTVTTVATYSSAYQIKIERVVSLTQNTEYDKYDAFPALSHEDALDKLTMIDQQQQAEIDTNEATMDAHIADTDDPHSTVSDTAYDATTWNGVTAKAPSKNAVRDKFVTNDAAISANTTANGLDLTHRTGNGLDHSQVTANRDDIALLSASSGTAVTLTDSSANYISLFDKTVYQNCIISFIIDDDTGVGATNIIKYVYDVQEIDGVAPQDDGGKTLPYKGSVISGVAITFDYSGNTARLVITLTGVGQNLNCVYSIRERTIIS